MTLFDLYQTHVHPLSVALAAASNRGVLIDVEARSKLRNQLSKKAKQCRGELEEIVGEGFNPNSSKQVMEYLYEKEKYPAVYKDGKRTSGEAALLKLLKKYPEDLFVSKLLAYRRDSKLLSTFLSTELDENNCIHTSYNTSGTDTFRISSSKSLWGSGANLQNIPTGKRRDRIGLRHLLIARPGCSFVKGDLVQAETMVVARILCRYGDHTLWEQYRDNPNFDVHKWAAAPIFDVPEDDVTSYQRSVGKIANHSGNYCAGPGVLQQTAILWGVEGIDYRLAKRIIDTRRKALPGLAKWWNAVGKKLRKDRTLTTCIGRRRIFFDRVDDNSTLRAAVAFEAQSVVGDVCNIIFRLLYERLKLPSQPLLQVHDEVVVECPDEEIEHVKAEMQKAAVVPLNLNENIEPLVIPIEISVGRNWRDCE